MRKKKRCAVVIMTNKARVLKRLRLEKGISMFIAGQEVGKSDSYISHIENGRSDIPKDGDLEKLLLVYGVDRNEFQELVVSYKPKLSKRETISNLLPRLDDNKLSQLLIIIEKSLSDQTFLSEVA